MLECQKNLWFPKQSYINMIGIIKYIKAIVVSPLLLLMVLATVCSSQKQIIENDLMRWEINGNYLLNWNVYLKLSMLLICKREFRNLFYKRIGRISYLFRIILRPLDNVSITACQIGPGFVMIHGFMTIINSSSIIGRNCTMMHNVTVGGGKNGSPVIGDNVFIGTGAIIIGGIRIGNNVKIGAGAIVVDDIPDNSVVVCDKAKILEKR